MQLFVRAVVTGFAMSLGSALFKKVSPHLGLAKKTKTKDKDKKSEAETPVPDPSANPVQLS